MLNKFFRRQSLVEEHRPAASIYLLIIRHL